MDSAISLLNSLEPHRGIYSHSQRIADNMLTRSATPVAAIRYTDMNSHETALERLYKDVWNGSNQDTADELVHEEFFIHDRELATEIQGPELYKALASRTREIFPDMMFTVEDVVAADEKVALRWTMTGTHQSEMFGMEPTGRQVEFSAIEINRFQDGKLIEAWTQSDQLGLMQQLGAIPVDD